MQEPWRITLLGELKAQREGIVVDRFRSRKTGALLAYLAVNLHRPHPREELIERFWPGSELYDGRSSLRTALASLRRQLEPPGVPAGGVLQADVATVRFNPLAVTVDAVDLREAASRARRLGLSDEAAVKASQSFPNADFLPGFYEDWVQDARNSLAHDWKQLLRHGRSAARRLGRVSEAMALARLLTDADALDEEAAQELVRLLAESGQLSAAKAHWSEFEQALNSALGRTPTSSFEALIEGAGSVISAATYAPLPEAQRKEPEQPHIPISFTRFFGREREIDQLITMLADHRLVTVTGPGGAGKTRLTVEVARLAGDANTWFVPLANVRDARQLPGAIQESLKLGRAREHSLEAVAEHLRSLASPVILVLDNFEQIAEEGAAILKELLERTPNLKLLVSSRQRLEIEGEQELSLLPLPVPSKAGSPERLLEFPSVQLFVDRARMARADFQITERNADAIATLCERLEGIPLAIEIAASRALVLTPDQMIAQLQKRLDFLVSRRRDIAERHRSLRAAIAWSNESLPAQLQQSFARLSVLRGSWTLEAAEGVCGLDLDALESLVAHSLVMPDPEQPGRFRMLEVIRDFADEQLGEEREAVRRRHFDYFLVVARRAEPELQGPRQSEALALLDSWKDNFRAALEWMDDPRQALSLPGSLWRFWFGRGYWREGREALERGLAAYGERDKIRLKAVHGAASLSTQLGDYPAARGWHEEMLDLSRELRDRSAEGDALHDMAVLAVTANEIDRGRRLHEDALAIRRDLGDQAGVAQSLNNLGNLAYDQNQFAQARELYNESLRIRRRLGDQRGVAVALNNLGNMASDEGDFSAASGHLEESLAFWKELGDPWGVALATGNLADIARKRGDLSAAHTLEAQCLVVRWELGDRKLVAGSFESMGHLLADEERWSEAATLLAAAQAIRDAVGLFIRPSEREAYDRNMARVRAGLGWQAFQTAWEKGMAMPVAEAFEFALRCSRDGQRSTR